MQSREGSSVFAAGSPVIGPDSARFPRRFAPRNDKLESFTPQNAYRRYCQPAWRSMSAATDAIGWCVFIGGRCGLQVPPRDCTPRALPRASRSGRHVGLWPPRNDNSGAFAILTAACTRRKCGAWSGMPLPYNGVCGRRECREIYRCATRRRGRRPLQRTAGSLGRFSAFRLPRAFLSCQIQKSDRLIWVSRSGFYGNTA